MDEVAAVEAAEAAEGATSAEIVGEEILVSNIVGRVLRLRRNTHLP